MPSPYGNLKWNCYLLLKLFLIASCRMADSAKPPTRKKNCNPWNARCWSRLLRCPTMPFKTGWNNFLMAVDPKQKYSFLMNWTSSVVHLANLLARSGPPCSETNVAKARGMRILVVSPSKARRPLFFISNSIRSSFLAILPDSSHGMFLPQQFQRTSQAGTRTPRQLLFHHIWSSGHLMDFFDIPIC